MLSKWMKKGLVTGMLVTSIALVVGCSSQEAPAPAAPEAPKTEAPASSTDTTVSASTTVNTDTTMSTSTTTSASTTVTSSTTTPAVEKKMKKGSK